tara:strand:- start:1889 stop:2383 length:495 start_codon:yes stop_codon:yes gene_type:complete
MAKIWDDLKSNVKVWSSVAVEKAEEVSKVAVAKTEELTKLSKIKLDIHNTQREIKKETYLFGKFVYSQVNESNIVNFAGNNEFLNHLEKIEVLQNQISSKESEIDKIKSEFNIDNEDEYENDPKITKSIDENLEIKDNKSDSLKDDTILNNESKSKIKSNKKEE